MLSYLVNLVLGSDSGGTSLVSLLVFLSLIQDEACYDCQKQFPACDPIYSACALFLSITTDSNDSFELNWVWGGGVV